MRFVICENFFLESFKHDINQRRVGCELLSDNDRLILNRLCSVMVGIVNFLIPYCP